MRRFAEAAAVLRGLERRLLPAACLICRGAIADREDDALVCGVCRSRWPAVSPPFCERCGQPGLPELICRICAEWPDALAAARSAVWLEEGARQAVHALKYGGWRRIAGSLALPMAALSPLAGAGALVPVPLGAKRLRTRGYNQAGTLADALGRLAGIPVRPDLLRRSRETPTQTALTPEERHANVGGAFAAAPTARGRRLVLVDDVFTTGATLVACAAALRQAGAAAVSAVTFARAPLPVR